MKAQTCQACSRRKVRCDHGEPCSNCTRRKEDCLYIELSSAERIKELEALVRSLRGGIAGTTPTDAVMTRAVSHQQPQDVLAKNKKESGTNPVMLNEDGETVYVESYVSHSHPALCTKL